MFVGFTEGADAGQRGHRVGHERGQNHLEAPPGSCLAASEGVVVVDGNEDEPDDNGIFEGTFDGGTVSRELEKFSHAVQG